MVKEIKLPLFSILYFIGLFQKKNQTRIYSDGVYYGDMIGESREGGGIYKFDNEDTYIGTWQNDEIHGLGVYYHKGGLPRYVGYFKNGLKYGYGIYTYKSGAVYKGDFAFGKRWGYGEITWVDGDKYIGQFKNDQLHGFGYWFFADGTRRAAFYYNGSEM